MLCLPNTIFPGSAAAYQGSASALDESDRTGAANAERRKKYVRETLLEILGGLPDYNGPLNARVTGRIEAESCVIEKVIFESLPGFFVTAQSLPAESSGRYPAVLLQSGHTQEGKP